MEGPPIERGQPREDPGRASGSILVLLPAFQEEEAIASVVEGVRGQGLPVLVIDDGSADDTAARAAAAGAEVIRLDRNRGKGIALEHGFAFAREHGHAAVITMDADGQHSPEDLPRFVSADSEGRYPVLVGNRMGSTSDMPVVRKWTNRLMSYLLSRVMRQSVPDTQNGYRLYRVEVLEGLVLDSARFAAESEILLHAAVRGVPIGSVPVRTIYGDERSKINPVKDTFRFLRMLKRFRERMREM